MTKAGTYWAALKGDKCETSDTIHITQNAGIKNYDGNSYSVLQLYPNPAHGTLGVSFNTVFTTEFTIGIYDMNGKKVLEQKYNSAAGENTFNLNISSLAPGDYILNMVSANFSTSRKFVVGE